MIQDTLQRLRGTQQAQLTGTTADAMTLISLGAEQHEAMTALLHALDDSAPRKFIGLFGLRAPAARPHY